MNEYTSKGGVARSHSDNGNLKDDGKHTFVFDYKNRLIGAFDKATNNPVAAYLYYCDNRRAKKIVYSQTSPGVIERQERFFYDGQQVVEETDDAGNTLLTWVYSPVYVDEPVQMVRSASHPLGAGTFYLHQNARADVVAVTDSSGSVAERRLFDDYGWSFDGVSKAPVSGSAVGNPYGFQGRRLDAETGLYYFRARYYDPGTGRFVQRDPVWDPGNFGNQYSFVGNGPVSGVDPEGLGAGPAFEDVGQSPLVKLGRWIGRLLGPSVDTGMVPSVGLAGQGIRILGQALKALSGAKGIRFATAVKRGLDATGMTAKQLAQAMRTASFWTKSRNKAKVDALMGFLGKARSSYSAGTLARASATAGAFRASLPRGPGIYHVVYKGIHYLGSTDDLWRRFGDVGHKGMELLRMPGAKATIVPLKIPGFDSLCKADQMHLLQIIEAASMKARGIVPGGSNWATALNSQRAIGNDKIKNYSEGLKHVLEKIEKLKPIKN